ncbi:MAG: type II/IV secretion system protein [Candidatus Kerfeldbacteria bacterium]|nr:type II/IV secretion system protein [Candidatus Kerfeldbacteria bacterium]
MVAKSVISALQKEGVLKKDALPRLREFERVKQGNVLDFVVAEQLMTSDRVIPMLRDAYQLPVVDLHATAINGDSLRMLPIGLCLEYDIVAFSHTDEHIWVAMAHPENRDILAFIKQRTGREVMPFLSDRGSIRTAIERSADASAEAEAVSIRQLVEHAATAGLSAEVMAKETPIIELVNRLIRFGLKRAASDMHIEPGVDHVVIRYRIDGLLHELFTLPVELLAPVIARIKIQSRLRLDEHMRPQDGRFAFIEDSRNVAIRVSVIPTLYGPKTALRFLDTDSAKLSLTSIGLTADHVEQLRTSLGASHGLILVTGPTGSGKTTTLYSMLNALHKRSVNISTIEDPIEYHIPGVNQIQVNGQVGLDFSDGLRSILRQDPDIIMVGEIRDRETAQIAINAALTGHLVLSSLHTNSAAGAIPRLVDMGIEPYLIASTLRAVVGQRLVRTVCSKCHQPMTTDEVPELLAGPLRAIPEVAAKHALTYAEGAGCPACLGTGYVGRTGLFEVMPIDATFHDVIMSRPNSRMLEEHAVGRGMKTLADDAVRKILDQKTTPTEVARVLTM